jgi:hypothetical protein
MSYTCMEVFMFFSLTYHVDPLEFVRHVLGPAAWLCSLLNAMALTCAISNYWEILNWLSCVFALSDQFLKFAHVKFILFLYRSFQSLSLVVLLIKDTQDTTMYGVAVTIPIWALATLESLSELFPSLVWLCSWLLTLLLTCFQMSSNGSTWSPLMSAFHVRCLAVLLTWDWRPVSLWCYDVIAVEYVIR